MDINMAFPSDYLKAADLQGREVAVTISNIQLQDIGGDQKPVMYFQGKDKGMVLNKTNANNIADAYGFETNSWVGKQIILFQSMVDFQGRTVPAIRVRVPPQQFDAPAQNTPVQNGPTQAQGGIGADIDDGIPF